MKVIICGSREDHVTDAQLDAVTAASGFEITEVVTGGSTGVDAAADAWARRNGIDRTVFHPNWIRHPKAGGPLRNARMAAYADACIAFAGGRGTANMVKLAVAAELPVYDVAARAREGKP